MREDCVQSRLEREREALFSVMLRNIIVFFKGTEGNETLSRTEAMSRPWCYSMSPSD